MHFGRALKSFCVEKGITARQLAERLGVSKVSVHASFRSESANMAKAKHVANVIDVPLWEIVKRAESIK
jgi:transcriptional regulator with XRE-family HTH domain